MSGPTLDAVLRVMGWTHERSAFGRRAVRDASGVVVIVGTARDVWDYLRANTGGRDE